jgi:aryl-alcohol dehydrogenase-like predicted oxidoreductase
MLVRKLGNSDLNITTIGFGAWAIGGGGWAFGWGSQDDNDSIASIREAIDLGINWIDTAAVYGLGHSEEVVAKALEGVSQRPYVFTKCGRVWDKKGRIDKRIKAASIRSECEASLKRLKVGAIDLYQMHWPEPDKDVEEGWQAMLKLKAEGKVRWVGVSNFSAEQMARAGKFGTITSLQPPYSMIRAAVEDTILPHCLQQNIGVISYSPMVSGLLTGKMTRERIAAMPADDWRKEKNPHYQEPLLSRNLALVEKLKLIGAQHGKNAGEVAVAWVLRHPAVTGAIVGARKPGQLKEIIGAADWRLTPTEVDEIQGFLKTNPA